MNITRVFAVRLHEKRKLYAGYEIIKTNIQDFLECPSFSWDGVNFPLSRRCALDLA